jgi:hypothetical protein
MMNLCADVTAWGQGHQDELEVFTCVENTAKIVVLKRPLLDIFAVTLHCFPLSWLGSELPQPLAGDETANVRARVAADIPESFSAHLACPSRDLSELSYDRGSVPDRKHGSESDATCCFKA